MSEWFNGWYDTVQITPGSLPGQSLDKYLQNWNKLQSSAVDNIKTKTAIQANYEHTHKLNLMKLKPALRASYTI